MSRGSSGESALLQRNNCFIRVDYSGMLYVCPSLKSIEDVVEMLIWEKRVGGVDHEQGL